MYPLVEENILFLLSIVVILVTLTAFVITVFATRWTTKPILIVILLVSSMTAYFMNIYNVVIDDSMIRNMMETNIDEATDLFSFKQVIYFIFLGLIPAYLVYKTPVSYSTFMIEQVRKLKYLLFLAIIMLSTIFIFYKQYSSFVREHKPLRYSTNPTYWIYSVGFYINATLTAGPVTISSLGRDAKVVKDKNALPKVVVLVVGEAARADHFSFNGYERETTPQLMKEDILNFTNVYSCGTSTAVSVPCMFSYYGKSDFSYKKGRDTENVLDILNHTNDISILWRENNSDSKAVALRVPFQYYKNDFYNKVCVEGECRDIGMLGGLDKYIQEQKGKDILIVLHQMGNHGPAYYKRYTKDFERFTPVCKTNQLEACTQEEIRNAYDNAILYTDNFLAKTIQVLKGFDKTHQSAMIYMSDHGQSLGEKGIYLHGLPYFMAPQAQIHIPAFIWMNEHFKSSLDIHNIDTNKKYTHDNLFHTLLGIFSVQTEVYDPALDIFNFTKD